MNSAMQHDGGEEVEAENPRLCAVTREHKPRDELIRFVADPAGRVVPDVKGRLPGRGVWISARRSIVEAARRNGAFPRSLKRQVTVADDLADLVERLLEKAALDRLALANKAGEVLMGFDKIWKALGSANAVLCLIHASEAAADGTRKLDGRMAARAEGGQAHRLLLFASSELSLALGRSNVIHAALKPGGASRKFVEDALRLERFRAIDKD